LIKKTVRRIKKVFVDNIYRVAGFAEAVIEKPKIRQKEKRSAEIGTQFSFSNEKALLSPTIVSPFRENVKPFYKQLNIFSEYFFNTRVGCDFTGNMY